MAAAAVVLAVALWPRPQGEPTIVDTPPTALAQAPEDQGATSTVVEPAGDLLDAGWSWHDIEPLAVWPATGGMLGRLGDGRYAAMANRGYQFTCLGCTIFLHDGTEWTPYPLQPFFGRRVENIGIDAGLIWIALADDETWSVSEIWVSGDAQSWSPVTVDAGNLPADGRPERHELVYPDSSGPVRFLRHEDALVSISIFGWMTLSIDNGQTFTPIAEPGGGIHPVDQAWVTEDGFFVVVNRVLWNSPNGSDWQVVGGVTGLPAWDRGYGSRPGPSVVTVDESRLVTMSFDRPVTFHTSNDRGLTWRELPGPYPFEDGALAAPIAGGWFHVGERDSDLSWISRDGSEWYLLDETERGETPYTYPAGIITRSLRSPGSGGSDDRPVWQYAEPPD